MSDQSSPKYKVALVFAGLVIGAFLGATLAPVFAARPAPAAPVATRAEGDAPEEQIDVGTRDVLERLKLLRVQMALDREEIEALKLRIEKIQLQREFDSMVGSGDDNDNERTQRRAVSASSNILVKAISLQPRKEAIIMYRGRIFTVRPGDRVGNIVIKDISENGLRVGAGRGSTTVR